MTFPRSGQLVFLLLLALQVVAFAEEQRPGNEPHANRPRSTDLRESVERRLIQLDVSLTGPADVISTLTSEDFALYVGNIALGGQRVEVLYVDRLCSDTAHPGETERGDAAGVERAAPPVPSSPAANYVFYFDQAHLSMEGRIRSLELARGMIDELVTPESPAMIVSSGAETRTFADLTDDRTALFDALGRIEQDPKQWDTFAELEWNRAVATLYSARNFGRNFTQFVAEATQEAEIDHTTTAVRRFAMVLRRLGDLRPPKVLFYFGDTLKSRPGQFYLRPQDFTDIGPRDRYAAAKVFDAMLNDAAEAGVRIYGIQAGYPHGLNSRTLGAARHTLVSLGKQTGGGSFLYGTPVEKMARKLRRDLSCFYVLSFDPAGLPEDRRLGVQLEVSRPKVKVQTRRQLIVRSETARKETELTAAFASPEVSPAGLPISGAAIPIGYVDGKYSILVQVTAPPSPLTTSNWNFGISPKYGGKANGVQRSVSVDRAGIPVVFEAEFDLPPGPHELALVVQNTTSQEIGTKLLRRDWPDPDGAPITIGPVSVLQPTEALFLRDELIRKRGFVIQGPEQPVRTDRRTALVTLICAGGSSDRGPVRVERFLTGSDSAAFPDIEIEMQGRDRCAQVRDLIPAGLMTEGGFAYEIRVLDGVRELAAREHVFEAVSGGPHLDRPPASNSGS